MRAERAALWLLPWLATALCGCRPASPEARFEAWLEDGHRAGADAYAASLRAAGTGDVLPPAALLRTGRNWRACGGREFDLPPRALQPGIAPTLALVRDLRQAGLLQGATAVSGYRSAGANRCEGGSSRSRHLANNAIDFDLADGRARDALCRYWRAHGGERRFGLGFYAGARIHVDTSGFRTWGNDYTRRTSPCLAPRPSAANPG